MAPSAPCSSDHRILPVSRTREAYWQARLLLATWARGGHDDDAHIVADHLRWLFLRCERPDGRWVRSHHADGRRKDHPFQADQQLYPLLELADFSSVTGRLPDLPPGAAWADLVAEAWSAVEAAIDEVAASSHRGRRDRRRPGPIHSSSRTRCCCGTVCRSTGRAGPDGGHGQGTIRHALGEPAGDGGRTLLCQRGIGQAVGRLDRWSWSLPKAFMDATDLPVCLAPMWGFCKPSDKVWQHDPGASLRRGESGLRAWRDRRTGFTTDAGHHGRSAISIAGPLPDSPTTLRRAEAALER